MDNNLISLPDNTLKTEQEKLTECLNESAQFLQHTKRILAEFKEFNRKAMEYVMKSAYKHH